MTKLLLILMMLIMLPGAQASAQEAPTAILLSEDSITVDGGEIGSDPSSAVYLALQAETHEDVPEQLRTLRNRVVTITAAGTYHISGTASDAQIAVRAGAEDEVRLVLDGAHLSCRTAPAIAVYSARDTRIPGEYGVTIELAQGSENTITGSHTVAEDDDGIEFDGAIGAQVSLGFEGSGSLMVEADNEGIEVASGHMTINGGRLSITAGDDPLNVSEDGFGVLTVNDGYVYSSVRPAAGGEGDGIDSNGYIVFNGGTVINLAHPDSQDGGIDSDMGSTINGGVIVGAGNMYDPIEADSEQLFMMLEFGQETDSLVVVTDEKDVPVFAYDFPHDYMYIAFSTPQLREGVYHVYLGGEIEGEQENGLYTSITSYIPGERMQHGEGNAAQRTRAGGEAPGRGGFDPMAAQAPGRGGFGPMAEQAPDMDGFSREMDAYMAYQQALTVLDLNTLLADADLNELLKGLDLNSLLTGFDVTELLTEDQIARYFTGIDLEAAQRFSAMDFGGRGGMRGMTSSAEVATTDFALSRSSTGFTNVRAAD